MKLAKPDFLSFLSLISIGLFALVSCGEGWVDPGPPLLPESELLAQLDSEIQAIVADATCADLADCRYIAYGAKPCGGPWTYLTYCVTAVDSARLDSLVDRHYATEAILNEREARTSDCMAVGPPELTLVEGKCATVFLMNCIPPNMPPSN